MTAFTILHGSLFHKLLILRLKNLFLTSFLKFSLTIDFISRNTDMHGNHIINIALLIVNVLVAICFDKITSQKIHRMNCRKEATFKANGKDFMVKSSSSKLVSTITTPLLPHCARSCLRKNECKSVVHKKSITEQNCQMLNVEKSSLANDDIQNSVGWIYYEPLQQVYFSTFINEEGSQFETNLR